MEVSRAVLDIDKNRMRKSEGDSNLRNDAKESLASTARLVKSCKPPFSRSCFNAPFMLYYSKKMAKRFCSAQ